MRQIGLWHVTDDGPQRLKSSGVGLEKHLEGWIEDDPDLLQEGLKIVGRQVGVEAGRLDLLAIDVQGRWAVIEIKAGPIYRETVAQALDYASCIATMPYDDLTQRANGYLKKNKTTTGEISIEKLLGEREAEEVENEGREVLIFVVGTGRALGLERMVDYLSSAYDLPISLVSYQVYETRESQKVLVRELSEPEDGSPAPSKKLHDTVEEICVKADRRGIGREFRAILEAARKHNLYPRPYKRSIMYTSPANRTRMLFTVWLGANKLEEKPILIAPEVFAEFYPIPKDEVRSILLGPGEERRLNYEDTDRFVASLDRLFERIEQGSRAREGE